MRRLLELLAGLVLTRMLGRPRRDAARPARARPARVRSRAAARPRPARPSPAAAPQRARGPLFGVTLGAFVVGAVLMLLFETWYTRTVGVLALFTFVVAGVFLLTGSGLLDPED
jgi:hypothetical protein